MMTNPSYSTSSVQISDTFSLSLTTSTSEETDMPFRRLSNTNSKLLDKHEGLSKSETSNSSSEAQNLGIYSQIYLKSVDTKGLEDECKIEFSTETFNAETSNLEQSTLSESNFKLYDSHKQRIHSPNLSPNFKSTSLDNNEDEHYLKKELETNTGSQEDMFEIAIPILPLRQSTNQTKLEEEGNFFYSPKFDHHSSSPHTLHPRTLSSSISESSSTTFQPYPFEFKGDSPQNAIQRDHMNPISSFSSSTSYDSFNILKTSSPNQYFTNQSHSPFQPQGYNLPLVTYPSKETPFTTSLPLCYYSLFSSPQFGKLVNKSYPSKFSALPHNPQETNPLLYSPPSKNSLPTSPLFGNSSLSNFPHTITSPLLSSTYHHNILSSTTASNCLAVGHQIPQHSNHSFLKSSPPFKSTSSSDNKPINYFTKSPSAHSPSHPSSSLNTHPLTSPKNSDKVNSSKNILRQYSNNLYHSPSLEKTINFSANPIPKRIKSSKEHTDNNTGSSPYLEWISPISSSTITSPLCFATPGYLLTHLQLRSIPERSASENFDLGSLLVLKSGGPLSPSSLPFLRDREICFIRRNWSHDIEALSRYKSPKEYLQFWCIPRLNTIPRPPWYEGLLAKIKIKSMKSFESQCTESACYEAYSESIKLPLNIHQNYNKLNSSPPFTHFVDPKLAPSSSINTQVKSNFTQKDNTTDITFENSNKYFESISTDTSPLLDNNKKRPLEISKLTNQGDNLMENELSTKLVAQKGNFLSNEGCNNVDPFKSYKKYPKVAYLNNIDYKDNINKNIEGCYSKNALEINTVEESNLFMKVLDIIKKCEKEKTTLSEEINPTQHEFTQEINIYRNIDEDTHETKSSSQEFTINADNEEIEEDGLLIQLRAQSSWNPLSIFGNAPPYMSLQELFTYETYTKWSTKEARSKNMVLQTLYKAKEIKDPTNSIDEKDWDTISTTLKRIWNTQQNLELDWRMDPLHTCELSWYINYKPFTIDLTHLVAEQHICFCPTPNPHARYGWTDSRVLASSGNNFGYSINTCENSLSPPQNYQV